MAYGELKVDSITFTNGGTDTTVSVSGLVQNPTFSGDITVTGTISGDVILGETTVSGATVTGAAGQFGTVTGNTAGFTTVTGTTVTGTTANFVTVSGTTVTGDAAQFTSVTGGTAGFTAVTGTTVTGTTANFVTVSGTAITGNTAGFTTVTGTTVTGGTGNFTSISATTTTITSGVFASGTAAAPSVSVGTTDNGLYSPGTDQVGISTNGAGRLLIDGSGRVGVGVTPESVFHVKGPQPSIILEKSSGLFSGLGFKTTGNATSDFVIIANSSESEFFSNQYAFNNVTGTEHMRLDSSGRLGLGTSSPSEQLTVSSTNNTILSVSTGNASAKLAVDNDRAADLIGGQIIGRWDNNDVARIDFYNGADGTNKDDGAIALSTSNGGSNPQERLYVSQSGNVGIGTTSPLAQTHITSTSAGSGAIALRLENNSGNAGTETILQFAANTSNSIIRGAQISGLLESNNGTNLLFYTNPNSASPLERARIDSSGTFRVKGAGTAGVDDAVQLNGSAPANSLLLDASGRVLVGTTTGSAAIQAGAAAPSSTEQCWAANTDAAYVITKSNVNTGTTTALFTLTTGGIGGASVLNNRRGILEIFLDVVGEAAYDTTGAGYYVSAYKVGISFNVLTASIAQVSEVQASVTQNMTVTVSGNVATYNVVFGSFSPNHSIASVTAYIRCIHKGLTIAAA